MPAENSASICGPKFDMKGQQKQHQIHVLQIMAFESENDQADRQTDPIFCVNCLLHITQLERSRGKGRKLAWQGAWHENTNGTAQLLRQRGRAGLKLRHVGKANIQTYALRPCMLEEARMRLYDYLITVA